MSETANLDQPVDCEPLLGLATADLYRRNAFRVLNLPVHATAREVQRLLHRRRLEARGVDASSRAGGVLALDTAPSDDDVRAAVERLSRPVDRLLDELFWFWPVGDGSDDEAMAALRRGDPVRAAAVWAALERTPHVHVAIHNLAVLDHMRALDIDAPAAAGRAPYAPRDLADLWGRAHARWREVHAAEPFWDAVRARIRAIDDAQLTTGFARQVRAALPAALLLVHARLAYEAAERGDTARAQRHIDLVRNAGFDEGLASHVIREAVRPARARLTAAIEQARRQWEQAPHRGDRRVQELHTQATRLLAILDTMLAADERTRAGLRDAVADAMLDGLIAFGNKTNLWQRAGELLRLVEPLAVGEAVTTRLTNNIRTVQENVKSGNDWCAPGYWDVPDDVVAALEAARAHHDAGDHEGAIRSLLPIDPGIGRPLRRAMARSLTSRGSRLANDGFTAFNEPTERMRRFLDDIQRRGSIAVPHPEMQSWQLPACPCCDRHSYQSWLHGEYNGQKWWMCSECGDRHKQERDGRQPALRTALADALQYALLAQELDPDDPGVQEDVASLRRLVKEQGATVPKVGALRTRLGSGVTRRIPQPLDAAQPAICFFCGRHEADASCGIVVPMCGDSRAVTFIFGPGTEYRATEAVVPRCQPCCDEHRHLPARIERWQDERADATEDACFPRETQAVERAATAARETAARLEQLRADAAAAQARVDEAEAVGRCCPRCTSTDGWRHYLCRSCDRELLRLPLWTTGALAIALFVLAAVQLPEAAIPVPLAALLTVGLKHRQRRRRRTVTQQRELEIDGRRPAAVVAAAETLRDATAALAAAEEERDARARALDAARAALEEARARALTAFERTHPVPALRGGVRPEPEFEAYQPIALRRSQQWRFGRDLTEALADRPTSVTGLVMRAIETDPVRPVVACPACGQRLRLPRSSPTATFACRACGHRFQQADARSASAAARRRNLERWQATGEPERWVKARGGSWSHDDWVALLQSLKESSYWPLDEDQVGLTIEGIRSRARDRRSAAR